MSTEVLSIGTELLLGQIVDTNSAWIGEHLAKNGVNCYFQSKVGDNLERMVAALRIALDRSDSVICSGGLGPTQDDVTREAVAAVLGVPLEFDEEMADRIQAMFGGRNRDMPKSNLRQAYRPEGSTFIREMPGTAPGLRCEVEWPSDGGSKKVIYALPGVPWEMKEMMAGTVLPELQARLGSGKIIESRTLRSWGMSESGLGESLAGRLEVLDEVGNPTIAFLASGVEGLKVRITASGASHAEVQALLAAEEAEVRAVLGDLIFGVDDETMEASVLAELAGRGLTLGVAESLTGGLVGARICDVPGASEVFRGSIVSYASDVKFDLLDVPEGPVISADAALSMAEGVREVLRTDVGISATGVAGPDSAEGHPPGTVCLAVVIGDPAEGGVERTAVLKLPGRRQQVREFSVISLLGMLRRELLALDNSGAGDSAQGDREAGDRVQEDTAEGGATLGSTSGDEASDSSDEFGSDEFGSGRSGGSRSDDNANAVVSAAARSVWGRKPARDTAAVPTDNQPDSAQRDDAPSDDEDRHSG
ncbi:MAG TPA: competence/damage-inducible protein A [Microthrixaceae bacterium]|nr:competence/damage-inducible protein A [Microthrixaceae bacterium]